MKFLLKILVYVAAMTANFALYVFLFLTLSGLSPEQSLSVMKTKAKQIGTQTAEAADSVTAGEEAAGGTESVRDSITMEMAKLDKERNAVVTEKTELQKVRDDIERLLAQKSKSDEEKMYKLAKIYDGMDQAKLAEIFSQMDDSLVMAVLPKMKSNNASLILEYLPPQRSARISQILLEGN